MTIDLRVAARGYLAAQRARGHRFADHDWLIRSFLDDLEQRRGNSTRTRNARLAAIHSLFSHAALRHPEHTVTRTDAADWALPRRTSRRRE